nr:MAG TPA: hypothetical protein [Caudoviricetes sp.]
MGVWGRMPLRSHSLSIPFSSFTQSGWRRCICRHPLCVQYAAPRRMRRAVAPDVWHHRLKADGPSLCAVRKRQGEKIIFG